MVHEDGFGDLRGGAAKSGYECIGGGRDLTKVLLLHPKAGEPLSAVCGGCHGVNGVSGDSATPSLAGQDEQYLVEAIKAYRTSRKRENMRTYVQGLSDADIGNIARVVDFLRHIDFMMCMGIASDDLDNDGNIDYVVSNLGLNTPYRASPAEPALAFVVPIRGEDQFIQALYEAGTLYPRAMRSVGPVIMKAGSPAVSTPSTCSKLTSSPSITYSVSRVLPLSKLKKKQVPAGTWAKAFISASR